MYSVYGWNNTENGSKCGGLLTVLDTIEQVESCIEMYNAGRFPNKHIHIVCSGETVYKA